LKSHRRTPLAIAALPVNQLAPTLAWLAPPNQLLQTCQPLNEGQDECIELHDSSAVELLAAYRGEDLSPVELTRHGSKAE
jgi:hypothetical protein